MFKVVQRVALTSAVALCGCFAVSAGQAWAGSDGSLSPVTTIHITSSTGAVVDPSSFDIAWVDQIHGRFYLSDGTNGAVDVINAKTDKFLGFIGQGQFNSGNAACTSVPGVGPHDCSSPKGLVTDKWGRVWVGNANGGSGSSVLVLNPHDVSTSLAANPASVIASIPTGGQVATDEMAYDPKDNVVFVANPGSADATVTWISARTLKVLGTYKFPSTGFNGIEQSVWDPRTDQFYVNLPGVGSTGTIDAFGPTPGSPTSSYSITNCGAGSPAGLVLVRDYLYSECANGLAVINAHTGSQTALISSLGGADEIASNGDQVYVPVAATEDLGVLNTWNGNVTLVPTGNAWTRVTLAAYRGNGQVFMAETGTTGFGIQVLGPTGHHHHGGGSDGYGHHHWPKHGHHHHHSR